MGAPNNLRATNGGDLELPALSTVTTTGNIFESLNVTSSGTGSLVNLSGLHSTTTFPTSLTIAQNGELDLGAVSSAFTFSFSANFANSSVGTLDIFDNQQFLTSISPSILNAYVPYEFAATIPQTGTPTLRFIADGAAANVTLQNFSVNPQIDWTGATNSSWSTNPADANWPGTTPWTNSANRGTPFSTAFNLATPAAVSINGNIDVAGVTFNTGGWSLVAGSGLLAFGGTGTLTVSTYTGADTISAIICNGAIFGSGGGVTSLDKDGAGTLTLAAGNIYTGGTTLSNGTLLVSNTAGSATGTGNVTLNGGTLGGSGKISGIVLAGIAPHTIAPSATLSGNTATTLTLAGLTTNANTTLAFNLTSAGASGVNDKLVITTKNALTLSGGAIAITNAASGPSSFGFYRLIQYTGTIQGTGISSLTLPSITNNISYTLDTAHDPGFVDIHRGFLGDANDDGKVDLNDLNTVLNNLGTTTAAWSSGNFDNASTIDLTDLNTVLNHLGVSVPISSASQPATAVPEPASLLLVSLAVTHLMTRRRSRPTTVKEQP